MLQQRVEYGGEREHEFVEHSSFDDVVNVVNVVNVAVNVLVEHDAEYDFVVFDELFVLYLIFLIILIASAEHDVIAAADDPGRLLGRAA